MDTESIQKRIRRWVESRLGTAAMSTHARVFIMLKKTVELAQALGVSAEEYDGVLKHVYGKPGGSVESEFGGAAVALFACAEAHDVILGQLLEKEMLRIEALGPDRFQQEPVAEAAPAQAIGVGVPWPTGHVPAPAAAPKHEPDPPISFGQHWPAERTFSVHEIPPEHQTATATPPAGSKVVVDDKPTDHAMDIGL